MIKIIHVITGLATGGAEMMLLKLLAGIDRSRFDPIVISLMDADTRIRQDIAELDVQIYTLGMTQGRVSVTALMQLVRMIRVFKPDIIQGWMYHGNIAASISRFLSFQKAPVIWNIRHSMHDLKFEKRTTAVLIRLGAFFSRSAEKVIYNSRMGARQHQRLGYAAHRTIVIPNGFDCEHFKPSTLSRQLLRKSLNVTENDILIGSIGRYHPQKDYGNLLSAAAILAEEYDNVFFVLIGRGIEHENLEIIAMIKQNKLSDRVHLLGERKDIANLMAGMDIIVSSSSFGEAFPNIIGEAMASGVPCAVTDVGDSAWIVGDTGKVAPPRQAESLARCCKELIEIGQNERSHLGRLARQRVLDNFTLDRVINQYEALYEQVIYTKASTR